MRIIAGQYKNSIIDAPKTPLTHPMSEKSRGALFNLLGDISNLVFLDAYSGSGAVAIEALSRQVSKAVVIENNPKALKTIKHNFSVLNLDKQLDVFSGRVGSFKSLLKFNIIFADPPFDKINLEEINYLTNFIAKDGIFILSYPGKKLAPSLTNLRMVKENNYGDNKLVIYQA